MVSQKLKHVRKSRCKKCHGQMTAAYKNKHREQFAISITASRLRKAGVKITSKQLKELHANSDGRCQICDRPEVKVNKASGKLHKLSVDHDHQTGVVRGLICDDCNRNLLPWLERLYGENTYKMRSLEDIVDKAKEHLGMQ